MNTTILKKLAKKYHKNYSHDVFASGSESFMIYKSGTVGFSLDKNKYGTFYNVMTEDAAHNFNSFDEAINFFERKAQNELS